VQGVQVLDGLSERVGAAVAVLWGAFGVGEDVGGEEGQAQAEVGRGEDGEGLDEDVGGRLVAGEMWVELVAAEVNASAKSSTGMYSQLIRCAGKVYQIELIKQTSTMPGFIQALSGNRKR
jgi:hypothetical protein